MMRQAGRYLPEYKETRKQAGGFLDLCYNPELAVEVTLQPIEKTFKDADLKAISDKVVAAAAKLGAELRG